jgi:hypothetical protein
MIDRRSAVGLVLMLPMAGSRTFAKTPAPRVRPLTEFPFELLGNAIYFQATVNGKGPFPFSLDTGSSNSVIASELVGELGIRTGTTFNSTGAGSDMNSAASIGTLEFGLPGGVRRSVRDGAAVSMSGLWQLPGKRFYGSIGYDVFSRFVLDVDYERRTIRLYDPASYTPVGRSFPAHMYGNYDPQVDGAIEVPGRPPIPVRLTLDTGAGGTIVSSPLVDKYDLVRATGRVTETEDKGVGGAVPTEVMARLSAIRIGPYVLDKPLVALSRDKMGSLANEAISVNMGGNILPRFRVVIDYPRKIVALTPSRHFSEPFKSDASGLLLSADARDFHKFTVDSVIPGSPAADAGMQPGDVILAANGKPAKAYALFELEDALKADGTVTRLSVRRGSETMDKTLKLRSLL